MEEFGSLTRGLERLKVEIAKCEAYISEDTEISEIILCSPRESVLIEQILCEICNKNIKETLEETLSVLNERKLVILDTIKSSLEKEYL